jgi:formylglycine-generating enzyme required for sulfatase activity
VSASNGPSTGSGLQAVSLSNGEPAVKPRPDRSLTGFYVAVCIVIALGLFGGWFWKTWTVWWFDADEAKRRQVEAARQLSLPVEKAVDLGGGVVMELVLVPAGRFRMGSPAKEKDRREDETQHRVSITRPFYIGKYEVTQEVWEKVMGSNPSFFKGAKNPVERVSWGNCQEFLKKLNALGKERDQFRLPTEAQWEYACRAGTRTRFSSGDADAGLADYAWSDANSGNTTHPVGAKQPNAWGLYDMHGNVWEWCSDWYDEDWYAKSPKDDPTGPATGSVRVVRGGSWDDPPAICQSAVRSFHPGHPSKIRGLRVLVVVPAPGP